MRKETKKNKNSMQEIPDVHELIIGHKESQKKQSNVSMFWRGYLPMTDYQMLKISNAGLIRRAKKFFCIILENRKEPFRVMGRGFLKQKFFLINIIYRKI